MWPYDYSRYARPVEEYGTYPKRIVIPKLPPTHEVEYECGECGMIFKGSMGYVCYNMRCPVFPVITCSVTDPKQTAISGGWI